MCGIFGTTKRLDDQQIARIQALLQHRGPDSHGNEAIELGDGRLVTFHHTRLAIQDLSPGGHQPMYSQCGRWCITFNGEIYNHFELRRDLPVRFRGTSDTETLVETIAAYGLEPTLQKINGIYAFSVLDIKAKALYIVRDPFGIKPVYYREVDRDITFSSEIKPLLALHGKCPLDHDGLSLYLALRYVPSPHTLLDGIKRLPPGHYLRYELDYPETKVSRYVKPTTGTYTGSVEDAVEDYHTMIGKAVRRQLLSDVPVGILLSGGIDSALVAHYARNHPGITGYTVGFGNQYADCEVADARETAAALGIKHKYVEVDPKRLIEHLPAIVNAIEEPLGTTSIMAMWSLTELARQDVAVALTGQGSDEPWGGYRRYKIEHLVGNFPILRSKLASLLRCGTALSHREEIIRGLSCIGINELGERFRRAYALFNDKEIAALISVGDNKLVRERIDSWLEWLPKDGDLPSAEQMMRIDTRMNLSDDLLLYGDKISMAFALEARVPMLDIELIQFVESLPLHYRSTFSHTKIVHKLTAERYLPRHIVNRKKKGFQVPFSEWSKTVWRSAVEDTMLDPGNPLFSVLKRDGLENIWRDHLKGGRNLSKQIFALLTLSVWAYNFL